MEEELSPSLDAVVLTRFGASIVVVDDDDVFNVKAPLNHGSLTSCLIFPPINICCGGFH